MPLIDFVIQIFILLIPSLILLNQIFLYYMYKKAEKILSSNVNIKEFPFLSIIVPTKGENISTIIGLLDNVMEFKWDLRRIEVIIVSDDDKEFVRQLENSLSTKELPFSVKVFLREKKLGFKSGALSYGLERSKGDLIITLDVDSRLNPDSIYRAYSRMLTLGCDAVSLKWMGYSQDSLSSLVKGLLVSTNLGSMVMLLGRHAAGFNVFPVGSGTLYKRGCLNKVGGWDYNMIQDDLEIGTRLTSMGYKICASDSPIFVEVPNNFVSFYVQQTRWAMGTTEVLKNRFTYIIHSNLKFHKKIEMMLYLLQYFPIGLTFLASILLPFIPFLHLPDPLFSPLFILWLVSISLYAIIYVRSARELNISIFDSLRSLGKISAYTVAISPFILFSLIKGFLGKRTYVVTPKGKKMSVSRKYNLIVSLVMLIGILFLLGGLFLILSHYYLVGLWLLYYSSGYIFTSFSYVKE